MKLLRNFPKQLQFRKSVARAGREIVADVSDARQGPTTTESKSAVCCVHPALSRRRRGSWPVTSVLAVMAMGRWVQRTFPPVQASVQQGTSPVMVLNPVSRAHRVCTSPTWDGPCVSPVEEDWAPRERAPAHSMTVKSKSSVPRAIITTRQYTGVSAALWGLIRLSLDRTTALPALETPPRILMEPQVSHSARTDNVAERWASSWVTLSHRTTLGITPPMWSASGISTRPASARSSS